MLLEVAPIPHLLHATAFIACTFEPNPFQWVAIISLLTASGITAVASGVGVIAIAQTIIGLIAAGATIDATVTALTAQITLLAGSSELLAWLVGTIFVILGCN